MKKFFKNLGKKSPAKGPPAGESPKLGASAKPGGSASLRIGYDVREKELGKLHKAAWTGDIGKVKQLAKKDASPLDKENRTPLHLACAQGHAAVVQELLEWKAKTNIGDNQAKTPLLKAVECGHGNCVALLLENHADVDAMDAGGNTCLHYAAQDGNTDIAKILVKARAATNARNKAGLSPLHICVMEKKEDICRLILKENADVNNEDKSGRTPLMKACQEGSINLVRLLLEYDADTTHKDTKGWTADDCAVIQGHHACSQLIADHNLKQRSSAASTPRTTSLSIVATPRDKDSILGIPAMDAAAGEDSGEETVSKASGAGAGAGGYDDSWGDDTDISIAADDKKGRLGVHVPKINLAKLLPESDEGDSSARTPRKIPRLEEDEDVQNRSPVKKQDSAKSLQSQTSAEDNSWSAPESPSSPRRNIPRVQFKRDEELSEIHDISMPSSEEGHHLPGAKTEVGQQPRNLPGESPGYVPTGLSGPTASTPFSQERQRAFMEELGICDDDISEGDVSEMSGAETNKVRRTSEGDSDWDSTVQSDLQTTPRPGILKNWKKQGDVDEEDEEDGEDHPGRASTEAEARDEASDWDSTVAEDAIREDNPPPLPTSPIPEQEEGMDSPQEVSPRLGQDIGPVESDWDSTVGTVSPRPNAGLTYNQVEDEDEYIQLVDHDNKAKNVSATVPVLPAAVSHDRVDGTVTVTTNQHQKAVALPAAAAADDDDDDDEEEESAWDSDGDMMPSDHAPPPPILTPANKVVAPLTSYHSRSGDSDEDIESETISEWEIERQKQKEELKNRSLKNVDFEEDLTDLTREGKVWQKEINAIQQEDKEEQERKEREEEEKRNERIRQEAEELQRQREWEEEERKKQERLKREADEALEQEKLDSADFSSEEESVSYANVQHATNRQKFDLSDSKLAHYGGNETNSSVDVQLGPPTIFMTESGEDGEELKRIEEEVRQEKLEKENNTFITHVAGQKQNGEHLASNSTQVPVLFQQQQSSTRQSSVYAPPPSLPPSFSTSHKLKQMLQVPPPNQMALQGNGVDYGDNNSITSDVIPSSPLNDKPPDFSSYYPGLLGPGGHGYNFDIVDDDALSYTSTEFEGDSMLGPPLGSSPFGKDMLLNLNMNDPTSLLKIQEHSREIQRQLDQEHNNRLMLENKLKVLGKEKNELQKKIDVLTQHKSSLEQGKLDLDAKIRGLEYNLREEQEKRRNAEVLLNKTKDQLSRKEEQFTDEIEAKQRGELTMRNIQLELRAANNKVKEYETELEELERQLHHEKEARLLQEKISEEQTRLQQHQQEKVKSLAQMADGISPRQGDVHLDEKGGEMSETYKAELYALQIELDRQRARFKDESALLATDNEDLHGRIEDLKNEIKLNEEALTQATMQYSVQIGSLKTENNVLSSTLERERANREKVETEFDSLKKRLNSTTLEMEKSHQARNELEREVQHEKEQWTKEMERKDQEISILKDNNQHLNQTLQAMEGKMNTLENELHVSNTSLLERTNQLQQMKEDLNKLKSSQETFDQNCRLEKEHNAKLQIKIEGLQEKLSQSQHEILNLKQQLENQKQLSTQEANIETQDKLNNMMISLRAESERAKMSLEEKNSTLNETVTRLREEMRNSENRRSTLEQDMRRLNQDYNDMIKKLSHAEASLEVANKMKEQVEQERGQLKLEVEKLQQKYQISHEKSIESQARVVELAERMERAEQSSMYSTQQLANTSANMQAFSRSKDEIEETMQKLQVENARLDAELKHERQRADMLYQDLQDSQKVRSSLEALCSNLKSTTAHLEEKLGEETATRTVLAQEAQDSKGLWEHEVVSRSKLGLRISQLERQKQELQAQLDEEKKKLRKAVELKKAAETKLEAEHEKCQQMQKEVINLKAHLRNAKKKMKLTENSELGYHSGDYDNVRQELEAKYRLELNRKLEEVNQYLEDQARARDKLDYSRSENESKLYSEKKRLEADVTELKLQYEKAVAQRETKELEAKRFRDLYEAEMKWRMRLSDQLQHTSDKALNYRSKLAVERHRTKLHGGLNFSAISNGISMDASRLNGTSDDPLSNKIRAELDRSIAKHLEAAPHDDVMPVIRSTEESVLNSSFAKSSANYYDILKRKYCV